MLTEHKKLAMIGYGYEARNRREFYREFMKTWKLVQAEQLVLESGESAPLENGEVKVHIDKVAFSATDAGIFHGKIPVSMPFVPGRHAVGTVVETQEGSYFQKGDVVMLNPYRPCEKCIECKQGRPAKCSALKMKGINSDGFLRDFINADEAFLQKLPETLSKDTALFTEYVALSIATLEKLDVQPGEHVALLCAGKLSHILAQLVTYYQAVPVIIDNDTDLLRQMQDGGYAYACNASADVSSFVFSVTGGRMCEKVVYPSRSFTDVNLALDLCENNGRICIMGCLGSVLLGDLAKVLKKNLTVLAANNGSNELSAAINLLVNKTVNVQNIIGKHIPFEDAATEIAATDTVYLQSHTLVIDV